VFSFFTKQHYVSNDGIITDNKKKKLLIHVAKVKIWEFEQMD